VIPALLLLTLLPASAAGAGDGLLPEPAEPQTAEAALTFEFAGCSADLARDVEEMVRADVSWAPGDPPAALAVRCAEASVTLLLAGDDSRRVTERKLELATTPPQARARTAALVATELILMGRRPVPPVLPARRGAPAVAAAEPVTVRTRSERGEPPPPPQERGGQRAALLALLGTALQGASGDVPSFDAGVRARLPVWPLVALAVDAAALYQRRTSDYGTSQALGGDLSVLAEARLGFAGGAVRPGLGVRAVGLRVGGTYAPGTLVRASSAWGAAAGPVARLAVSAERRHGVGELALAGGWCGPEVVGTAGGGSPIGVGGWWAGVTVAAGWLFE